MSKIFLLYKNVTGPAHYYHFVDDTFAVFKRETDIPAYLDMLKSVHPNLHFTVMWKVEVPFLSQTSLLVKTTEFCQLLFIESRLGQAFIFISLASFLSLLSETWLKICIYELDAFVQRTPSTPSCTSYPRLSNRTDIHFRSLRSTAEFQSIVSRCLGLKEKRLTWLFRSWETSSSPT